MMSAIAVITARSGSRRIPGKNVRAFCGKPILAYGIEAALGSGIFDEVMVSTDSRAIADIAMNYGAAVPFLRSEKASDDFATTADVLEEVLRRYGKNGRTFDVVCCIYPTAPFVTCQKLRSALRKLEESQAAALMPVVRFSYPPQRAVVVREGLLAWQYPQYERARSQDLEPVYHDSGQFYMSRTDAFRQYHSFVTPETIPFILPEEEVQDIDTESDWKLAEMKYQAFVMKEEK